MINIAINGFGRIGRNILRAIFENPKYMDKINLVVINDLAPISTSKHLLKYDSVHGIFKEEVDNDESAIIVNGHRIIYYSETNPEDLPWKDFEIDIVFECTGRFTHKEDAISHLKAGAKKVLISAPGKDVDNTIVYGVNHKTLNNDDFIVSNASCTTNCLAPIAKVLEEEFGISKGLMTTIHAYTGDQKIVDTAHSDLFRARAAAQSMIPTKTGAAKSLGLVLPSLSGKVDGMAMRVPTANVSVVDFTVLLEKNTDIKEINKAMKKASESYLKGILGYNEEPLVSIDYNHNTNSSIYDSTQIIQVEDNLFKIISWYDNEWGFSNRMLDTAIYWDSI